MIESVPFACTLMLCEVQNYTETHKLQLFVCHVDRNTVNTEALSLAFDKLISQQAETLQLPHGHILH